MSEYNTDLNYDCKYPVQMQGVTKNYAIYDSNAKRALGTLGFKVPRGDFLAVNDFSYNFEKGEVTAILGRNGSGKSTLLKLITGVTQPDTGTISTHGRISAMLELRSGFDKEMTGEENIAYKGLTMGIPPAEFEQLKDEIIEFADIGIHINQPYRTYSSGMKARLGFAVAASINPDILIIDEALSVGDEVFKLKCIAKMNEFREAGKTILFVSHSMGTVKAFCTRAVWINQGKLMSKGTVGDVVVEYEEFLKTERAKAKEKAKEKALSDQTPTSRDDVLFIQNSKFINKDGKDTRDFIYGQPMRIEFEYHVKMKIDNLTAAITIENAEGVKVFSSDTQAGHLISSMGWHKGIMQFEDLKLIPGAYSVTLELWDTSSSLMKRSMTNQWFNIIQDKYVGTGIVYLEHEVLSEDFVDES